MPMEIITQSPPTGDFNFDSASPSPYTSCPSSPQRFGNCFFSAPNSPTRAAAFYRDHFWDTEKDGTHIANKTHPNQKKEGDFEFHFIGPLERHSLSAADELFDGGKIRSLKPPPGSQNMDNQIQSNSPKQQEENLEKASFPRQKSKENDSFPKEEARGEKNQDHQSTKQSSNSVLSSWYNKLKLKDLLLFRSISEGHKEKYGRLMKKSYNEDMKNSSFRSNGSGGGGESVSSRRRVSAHEWHYTANRAAAMEMRKKSFLPYKQGLLGCCLGFHPPVVNELSRGFGSYVMREE